MKISYRWCFFTSYGQPDVHCNLVLLIVHADIVFCWRHLSGLIYSVFSVLVYLSVCMQQALSVLNYQHVVLFNVEFCVVNAMIFFFLLL